MIVLPSAASASAHRPGAARPACGAEHAKTHVSLQLPTALPGIPTMRPTLSFLSSAATLLACSFLVAVLAGTEPQAHAAALPGAATASEHTPRAEAPPAEAMQNEAANDAPTAAGTAANPAPNSAATEAKMPVHERYRAWLT